MKHDPFDVRLVTHHGKLHGCCEVVVHKSGLWTLLNRLREDKLRVVQVQKLGWVDASEDMPKQEEA